MADGYSISGAGLRVGAEMESHRLALKGEQHCTAIVAIAAGLLGIGAVMSFSASATLARPMIGWDFWNFPAVRQLLFVGLGLIAMLISLQIPYRIWFLRRGMPAIILLAVAVVFSLLVFVPHVGVEVNNARRWVRFGPIQFQPSEMVKIGLPIFLAAWMTLRADIRAFSRGLLPAVAVIGLAVGAVGLEDFGTGTLLAAVAGAMLLVGGAKIWHLLLLILPAVPAFGYLLISRAHRMERLMTFLNIWEDPEGKGYQVVQSLCTIASGGWFGRGLGQGFVKGYLPEARNDFIFAVIYEELGMAGAAAVIGLFLVLLWKGRQVVVQSPDPAGRLLAFGIVLTVGIQAAINIAVVTVSVPTKGIALPFVSAGGTGVIFLGILIGVLANIARHIGRGVGNLSGDGGNGS